MPYVKTIPSVKVSLVSDPAYWVLWRPVLRYGQIKEVTVAASSQGQRGEMTVDSGAVADGVILAHIEDWNLTDERDQKLPITPASLALLEDRDVDHLTDLLQKTVDQEEKERKN